MTVITELRDSITKIDERNSLLNTELHEIEQRKEMKEQQYRRMLTLDSTGEQSFSTEEFNETKHQVNLMVVEMQTVRDRIDLLSQVKKEKQLELLNNIREHYKEEMSLIEAEVERYFNEARHYRAKLAVSLYNAGVHRNLAFKLLNEVNAIEKTVGTELSSKQQQRVSYPFLYRLPNDSDNKSVTPGKGVFTNAEELDHIFNEGILPAWVGAYVTEGDLITEADAEEKAKNKFRPASKGVISKLISVFTDTE